MVFSLAIALLACTSQAYSPESVCCGRLPGWRSPSDGIGELAVLQLITIRKTGHLGWNGREINQAKLDLYLRRVAEMDPSPQVILRIEGGADCRTLEKVRSRMDRILDCKRGVVCGEGKGWRRWPGAKPEA